MQYSCAPFLAVFATMTTLAPGCASDYAVDAVHAQCTTSEPVFEREEPPQGEDEPDERADLIALWDELKVRQAQSCDFASCPAGGSQEIAVVDSKPDHGSFVVQVAGGDPAQGVSGIAPGATTSEYYTRFDDSSYCQLHPSECVGDAVLEAFDRAMAVPGRVIFEPFSVYGSHLCLPGRMSKLCLLSAKLGVEDTVELLEKARLYAEETCGVVIFARGFLESGVARDPKVLEALEASHVTVATTADPPPGALPADVVVRHERNQESIATAVTAGIVALMRAQAGQLCGAEIRELLRDPDHFGGGRVPIGTDYDVTLIDALSAVQIAGGVCE